MQMVSRVGGAASATCASCCGCVGTAARRHSLWLCRLKATKAASVMATSAVLSASPDTCTRAIPGAAMRAPGLQAACRVADWGEGGPRDGCEFRIQAPSYCESVCDQSA